MILGGKHVEDPYIVVGQIATGLYFSWFLIFVPFFSTLERVLLSVHSTKSS
jgi:ubiquinol-cytochrome c reductase cytochrome b subunit